MDWRLRIAWWLVLATLLVCALTPVETRHTPGGRGGRTHRGSTGRVHRRTTTHKPPTRYDGKPRTTPKTKVHGSQHQKNSGGRHYEPTEDFWDIFKQNNKGHHKPTETIPTTTTHRHRHNHQSMHQNHTKATNSKQNQTRISTSQVTRQPSILTQFLVAEQNAAGSYNRPGGVAQRPNIYMPSPVTKKNSTSSHNSPPRGQPSLPTSKPGYGGTLKPMPKTDVQHTTSSGHHNKSVEAVTGKNYQHPELTIATPNATTKNNSWYGFVHKNHTKSTDPKHNTTNTFKTIQRPPNTNVKPPASKMNSTGSRNSSTAVSPTTTTGVPAHTTTSKALPSTQRPNIYPTSPVSKKNSTSSPNSPPRGQPSLPTSKTGGTESKTAPPYRSPGHTTPANNLKEGKPGNSPVHPPPYPGYPGSQSQGPQWRPPGYVPISSIMPGFNVSLSSRGGLVYSKINPSSPTVFQITHYHYPSSIPSKGSKGCDCYVKGLTAACISKLKYKRIPSCVKSTVTALFIKSKEVHELSIDAFSKVKHLKYINITHTNLISLPRDFFRDTKQLLHLVVQKNPKLKYLHRDVFRDAFKLEDVILDRNSISSLDRDVFTNLTNVKRLNLGHNKIRSLPKGIFRDNRELQELRLTGNPLHISSETARDLLKNNAKLRVLLMSSCELNELPIGLLNNASNLEWLDLSYNSISKFPAEFIRDCAKLGYLRLAHNNLTVLSSDVLHQHGGSLSTLKLEENPWRCDCDLVPLASWAALRHKSVPVRPRCGSPRSVRKQPLRRWLHSEDAAKCGGATSSLLTDLNRVLSVARAIAKEGPDVFTNLLKVSDKEVSFAAANYFSYSVPARTDTDVGGVAWHWARFLEGVLDRRHLRYTDAEAKMGANSISLGWSAPTHKNISEENLRSNFDTRLAPLATTTTKPPVASGLQQPLRPKGIELLVDFTNTMKNFPENLTKVGVDGIEEKLKVLFGLINSTNTTSPGATEATVRALGPLTTTTTKPPVTSGLQQPLRPKGIELLVDFTNIMKNFPENLTKLVDDGIEQELKVLFGVINGTNTTSPGATEATVRALNSTGFSATTTPASGVPVPLMKLNATKVVAGLRSELREVLSILLQSIDRANWDAAYEKYVEEEEKRAQTSSKSEETTSANNSAESYVLIQPQLTVHVAFLSLLAHTFM